MHVYFSLYIGALFPMGPRFIFAFDVNRCFQIMPRSCGCVKNPRTGHWLRLADLESPSGTDVRRVFPSHFISNRLTHPEQNKVKGLTKALCFFPSDLSVRLRFVSYSARFSLTVNGWMGGQATAPQPQQSASASADRPCESPCARDCRWFSQAGMGSAMESRNYMRTKRDATDLESDSLAY